MQRRPRSLLAGVLRLVFTISLVSIVSACNTAPVKPSENFPVIIAAEPPSTVVDGSIYNTSNNRFLFEDVRARRVGDVINVVLEERTDATKAASTSTNKGSGIDIPGPTILGGPVEALGREIFSTDIKSQKEFSGQADSSQSNRLSGSVAVTVTHKMANGNLWIQGQKTLTLKSGQRNCKSIRANTSNRYSTR